MGAKRIHPISFSQDTANAISNRHASSLLNTNQPCPTPDATKIELLLDSLICSYSQIKMAENIDKNIALDTVAKMIDMSNSVSDRVSEDRVYQRLLASAARCLSVQGSSSPAKIAKASQLLAEIAKYSADNNNKGKWRWNSSVLTSSSMLEMIEQSQLALKAVEEAISLKVEKKSSKSTLKFVLQKAWKTNKDKKCSMAELKRAIELVKNDKKEHLADNLLKVSNELEKGLNKVELKLCFLKSLLVQTRISLLDFITYSL